MKRVDDAEVTSTLSTGARQQMVEADHDEGRRAEHLRSLAREALEALVLERAEADEGFALWLDARLAASLPREAGAQLDPARVRRRAEALFSAAGPGYRRRPWDDRGAVVDGAALDELIGEAAPFLAAGRGADALAILKPVAGALAEYWPEYAPWDETLHEFFPVLDRMIAQAVLMDGVSREARDDFVDELSDWQRELDEFGADNAFSTAIAACVQGWDEPGLEEALAGSGQFWPPGGSGDLLEDNLTRARLAALEAMGRTQAYLHLSRAAGFHCDHAVKLVQTGHVDEAIALARARLFAPDDILRLAEAVAAAGELQASLDLAAWGLSIPERGDDGADWRCRAGRMSLARWLREAAHEAGKRDMMIMAAQVAFEEGLNRDDFRAAEKLAAASEWPKLRENLLAALMAARHAYDRLAILLDEDLVDEAVTCVDPNNGGFFSPRDETLERLAERAYADHPDWAIALAFRVADPIMEEGQSGLYATAAHWLGIAARAHRACGRSDEWRVRLEALIEKHRRKYKLRPLLEALRLTAS